MSEEYKTAWFIAALVTAALCCLMFNVRGCTKQQNEGRIECLKLGAPPHECLRLVTQ